jgi:DNA-directed RNA polymerase beta' subunit
MPTLTVTRWQYTCHLSDAAQFEAREIMAANKNLLKPADGTPILHIEQDIVLGAFYMTYDKFADAKLKCLCRHQRSLDGTR